jgi:hypothetical protein
VIKILENAHNFSKQSGLSEFYEYVLKPVMYETRNLWAINKLDISTEHVYSNIANEVIIHFINGSHKKFQNKIKC